LRDNDIHTIDPEAFDNNQKLNLLDLRFNECVDKNFEAPENKTLDWTAVKKDLKKCFDNFNLL
jgi:hypothetical protein